MSKFESEQRLHQQAEKLLLSPTHDINHSETVISFGLDLLERYGGDSEVFIAAAYFHDLARNYPSAFIGGDGARESARLAGPILEEVGFPTEKIDQVCQVIAEHDQPEMETTSIEAQILSEADFLAGFGPWGLLRSLVWSGERGEPLEKTMRRLKEKMPARIKSLRFPESKEYARRQYQFVRLFLAFLEQPVSLEKELLPGKYIVFEGTSGTGKETQARLLVEELERRGEKAVLVFEPTQNSKPVLAQWRLEIDSHLMELFFYITDRVRIMEKETLPTLKRGDTAVSIRSGVSTLVYETKDKQEEALVHFLHSLIGVPEIDAVIHLDVPEDEAFERIQRRHIEKGEPLSKFEKRDKLKEDRKKYKEVLGDFERVTTIDGSPSISEVHQTIIKALEEQGII